MILEAQEGQELRTARKSAVPTQVMAAAILDMTPPTYIKLEKNQDTIRLGELEKLFNVLGTDGKDTIKAWLAKKFSIQCLENKAPEPAIR